MAEKEKEKAAVSGKPAEGREAPAAVYKVHELAAAARQQFGCGSEVVRAAFLYAGRREATLAEAKALVEKFRRQEVR